MTMKIIMRTRSTSISGTMFGSDIEPLLPPTAIPMENSFTKRLPVRIAAKCWSATARRISNRLIGGRGGGGGWGRGGPPPPPPPYIESTNRRAEGEERLGSSHGFFLSAGRGDRLPRNG